MVCQAEYFIDFMRVEVTVSTLESVNDYFDN